MKNKLPLRALPNVLQNLHQHGFGVAFETDDLGMLNKQGHHFAPHDLAILQEMEFAGEDCVDNDLSLLVCECMDGELGYALINWPCKGQAHSLQNLIREIPRICHDEWRPIELQPAIGESTPQTAHQFHNFKPLFN